MPVRRSSGRAEQTWMSESKADKIEKSSGFENGYHIGEQHTLTGYCAQHNLGKQEAFAKRLESRLLQRPPRSEKVMRLSDATSRRKRVIRIDFFDGIRAPQEAHTESLHEPHNARHLCNVDTNAVQHRAVLEIEFNNDHGRGCGFE